MKKDIHAKDYRAVLFSDNSSGAEFVISSTIATKETKKAKDGQTYPVHYVEISSASHPFYTNQEKIVDTAGRVEKFKTRVAKSATKKTAKKA